MRLTNMTSTRQGPALSRWLLPVGAAAAVVLVVAAVGVVAGVGSGKGPAQPPVLRLANVAGGSAGLSFSPAAAASDKGGSPFKGGVPVSGARGSGWQLVGALPQGPSSGRVYLLPAAATTRAFISALAGALGMSGAPRHLKGGWYVMSGTTELSVSEQDGGHWTYSNHGCIAGPVLDPQVGTACAVAKSSPPSEVAKPIPVAENVARSLARPVLEAVGVNAASARVDTEGGQQSVVLIPKVGGSTVIGLETRVSVDEQSQVVDASGWLATPTAAAAYPLMSARQAYDHLLQQPQPMMALAMPCRILPGKRDCAPIPDRVVTGATLGLTQAYATDRGILLVPAWLFQVRGQSTPVAVVAVQRAFLGQPEPTTPVPGSIDGGQPGSVGGGSGSVGSQPGSVGGAVAPNRTTEATGAPTLLEQSGPATAPGTSPVPPPR
jgi:hypothetical protein